MALLSGPIHTGWTPFTDRHPGTVLEGNWQSCRDDGDYGERIYDAYDPISHRGLYELHLGPYHDFALFRGVDMNTHRSHDSAGNLLHPYTVDVAAGQGKQTWHALGMTITVTLAGGSYDDCESWWVVVSGNAGDL